MAMVAVLLYKCARCQTVIEAPMVTTSASIIKTVAEAAATAAAASVAVAAASTAVVAKKRVRDSTIEAEKITMATDEYNSSGPVSLREE